jgi:hypothetical protein
VDDVRELLQRTAAIAADYVESLGDRPVFPDVTPEQLRTELGGPLPEQPVDAGQVVTELANAAERGVVAMGSGRYFGFVIGGALPAASLQTGSRRRGTRTPASTSAGPRPRWWSR